MIAAPPPAEFRDADTTVEEALYSEPHYSTVHESPVVERRRPATPPFPSPPSTPELEGAGAAAAAAAAEGHLSPLKWVYI